MDPMNPMGKMPGRIKYEYKDADKAPLHYAHGVWGGINPHGEIEMNIYTESDKMPAHSERIVHADGSVGPEMVVEDEETKTIVRTVHTKVVVSYETARAVIEWLEEKVQALEMESGHPNFHFEGDQGPEQ